MKPWMHAYWNYFLFHRSRSVWQFVAGSLAPDAPSLTHVTDAYPFFWPLSWRLFPSRMSYWETIHHSREWVLLNAAAVALSLAYLAYSWYRRHRLRV